ncbi:hypothetical protein GCM10010961_28500 [Pseudodonghicola xiamenensis]|uniref:Uncharacterized protein n=1 Tax=Pseudodonghicola xiamenensis TaxID=337702 RepID=A0A8J3H9M7_9RHOB|nr:hypothetical protein GCM10010961_28500 [Pseudodonghicola xiamenensis]
MRRDDSQTAASKSLDSFDFKAIPKLNKMQVLELARGKWIAQRENVIALGPVRHCRSDQWRDMLTDPLPVESAFIGSLCSGFGSLLTVGDTPTG